MKISNNLLVDFLLRPTVSTTGIPNNFSNLAVEILIPFLFASSIILRSTNTGIRRSSNCKHKNKLRSILEESMTSTIISGFSPLK